MKLSEGLLHRHEPGNRSFIFNTENGHTHVLNQTATMMLDIALTATDDDPASVQSRLRKEFSGYDMAPDEIGRDYVEFVSSLVAGGFLQVEQEA